MIGTMKSSFGGLGPACPERSRWKSSMVASGSSSHASACWRPCCSRAVRAPAARARSMPLSPASRSRSPWTTGRSGEDPKSLSVVRDADDRPGLRVGLRGEAARLPDSGRGHGRMPTSASRSRSLWDQQGKSKAVEKKASYVVGTSPSVTVFRDSCGIETVTGHPPASVALPPRRSLQDDRFINTCSSGALSKCS